MTIMIMTTMPNGTSTMTRETLSTTGKTGTMKTGKNGTKNGKKNGMTNTTEIQTMQNTSL